MRLVFKPWSETDPLSLYPPMRMWVDGVEFPWRVRILDIRGRWSDTAEMFYDVNVVHNHGTMEFINVSMDLPDLLEGHDRDTHRRWLCVKCLEPYPCSLREMTEGLK